jgi:hypothetical protein
VGGTHAELGIRGEGKAANEHLTDAITAYRKALEVYTRERLPQVWAAVQTNLGNAIHAQGAPSEGSQRNELLAQVVAGTAAPWRCIHPNASSLTTSECRRISESKGPA